MNQTKWARGAHSQVVNDLHDLAAAIYKRDGTLPVIAKGSDAEIEWRKFRVRNGMVTSFWDTQPLHTVPTEYPPENAGRALAELAPARQRLAE